MEFVWQKQVSYIWRCQHIGPQMWQGSFGSFTIKFQTTSFKFQVSSFIYLLTSTQSKWTIIGLLWWKQTWILEKILLRGKNPEPELMLVLRHLGQYRYIIPLSRHKNLDSESPLTRFFRQQITVYNGAEIFHFWLDLGF